MSEVQEPMSHEKPRRRGKNSAQNERAGYLLNFFAVALATQDPRKQKLVADFERLSDES